MDFQGRASEVKESFRPHVEHSTIVCRLLILYLHFYGLLYWACMLEHVFSAHNKFKNQSFLGLHQTDALFAAARVHCVQMKHPPLCLRTISIYAPCPISFSVTAVLINRPAPDTYTRCSSRDPGTRLLSCRAVTI